MCPDAAGCLPVCTRHLRRVESMSAFRARVLLGGFLLIFVGVAFNAMLMQRDGLPWSNIALLSSEADDDSAETKPQRRRVRRVLPRWNPIVTASTQDQLAKSGEEKAALPKPVLATTISVTRSRKVGRETVRAIQRELTARGYEPGPVDGILGIMTRAAILAYEQDSKLPLTANPSTGLLERIILGDVGQASKAHKIPPTENARLLARSVQESLARLGYVPGKADGIVHQNTARAIKAFERDHNLAPTGRISGRLVSEIGRVNGARLSFAAGW